MNKVKVRFVTIISLIALFAVVLGVALGLLSPAARVYAAEVTYSPSSIFWARTGGEVKAYKANAAASEAYVALLLKDGGSVEYHRDLALKWYVSAKPASSGTEDEGTEGGGTQTTAAAPAEGEPVNPGKEVMYSMTISFPRVDFEKLTITYQSAEENVSKKEQAINELVFVNEADKLFAYVKDASHAEDEEEYEPLESEKHAIANKTAALAITFEEAEIAGDFIVKINDEQVGTFTNIGGYFMEYRTSGTANTPMTFTAELPEDATATSQKVLVHQLNGQSLEVKDGTDATAAEEDGALEVTGGKVTDDTPAALVLNEKVYAFTLGQRFSLSYEVIDVCYDSSITPTRSYYMLKKDEDGSWHAPDESSDNSDGDYKTLTTSTYFMPTDDNNDEEVEYVSIRFVLPDGRDNAKNEYIYLSWYAALDSDVVVTKGNAGKDNFFDYIKVDREKAGPEYIGMTSKLDGDKNVNVFGDDVERDTGDVDKDGNTTEPVAFARYQTTLNELAEKASAGDGAYFYLPSLRNLIDSKYADYRNLRFNIYYYAPGKTEGSTATSATSLRYNNLRIEIEKPGTYKFRVCASDASGNAMQMYVDGKLTDVTSSNIWDIEEIPDFTFKVGYTGAVIDDAGDQSLGYRGSVYNITDFKVIALGDCVKDYTLYYFDTSKLDSGVTRPTYSDFVKNTKDYVDNAAYSKALREIGEFNDELEEDSWESLYPDNAYHWDPDALSFIPQESGFYVVKMHLLDPSYDAGHETDAYQVIDVRNPVDYIPGQTDWFRNNVTSVILFAISGVLAVIIVVLFVVKPSDKTVEEVDLAKLKGKKEKKNKNKE